MESKSPKGKARPPAVMEWVVRSLLPPAVREEVIGDLSERYRSPLSYASEALSVMSYLIGSQIRRNVNLPIMAILAFVFFVFSFRGLAPDTATIDVPPWLRALIPTVAALIGLLLRDVYRGPESQPAQRAAFDVMAAVVCIAASQAVLIELMRTGAISGDWLLSSRRVLMTVLALPMVFCLRLAANYRLPCTIGQISVSDLAHEFFAFERGVRWRNRAILIGGILGAGVSVMLFFRMPQLALTSRIGWAISTPLGLFITWYIARVTSVTTLPGNLGFATALAHYRSELERQSRLLRSVWWWYLLSIVPAVAGGIIGKQLDTSAPALGPYRPEQVGAYIVICVFVGWLYVQYARKFKDRIDSLATLKEQP